MLPQADRWTERIEAVTRTAVAVSEEEGTSDSNCGIFTQAVELGSRYLRQARALLLYHYLPYDKTIWGRIESPPSLILMIVASWPEVRARTRNT